MSERTVMDMVTAALEEHGDDVLEAVLVIQSTENLTVHSTTGRRSVRVGMLEVAKDVAMRGGDKS